jgi:toxin YoeB
MPDVIFSTKALQEYVEWQTGDRKNLKRINDLIKDILKNGFMKGIGKPEPLKHIKAYSRRIDDTNRLVYSGDEKQNLRIVSCKGHYKE